MTATRRATYQQLSRAAAAVLLVLSILMVVEPAPARGATEGVLDARIVIEWQAFPDPPLDPNRCIAVAFVEVAEAIGGSDYHVTVFDNLFQKDDERFGPPFVDDDYEYGKFHSVVEPGRHRWALSAYGSPHGCADARSAFDGRFTKPRGKVSSFHLCEGYAVTKVGTNSDDILVGTKWADTILGLDGNDRLIGGRGDDVLCGGLGTDVLSGGPGNDILEGGKGKDLMKGGRGNDKLNGGPGFDTVDYKSAKSPITANLNIGHATGEGTDKFFYTENLRGSPFSDTLIGSRGKNRLIGRQGDDLLKGLPGDDILKGNGGDDDLNGGRGSDKGDGGTGTDTCTLVESPSNCE